MTDLQGLKSRFRLLLACADALWRRWRRTGSLRTVDRFDTFPRELSQAEVARVEEILRHRETP
jgi:transposase